MKINIGKQTQTAKPIPSLAEQLKVSVETPEEIEEKKPNSGLSLNSLNKKQTTTQNVSQVVKNADSLASALANSQNSLQEMPAVQVSPENQIPPLADLSEKYVLTADASESLPEEVLTGFAERMQSLIDYIDSPELHTALADILKYTQTNPNLKGILREADVQLFVRAARKASGLVVMTKTANKTKKKKSDEVFDSLKDELAGLELSL